uniref:Biogenesis of lysosome-related organelles complex 1 subunit 7 n=1 Tax=Rhizophora mucronata TaxID=61149 RepID=A0A2P2K5X2_RHIMU
MEAPKENSADVADASGVLVDSVSWNESNVESETGPDGRIGHDSTDIKNSGAATASGINKTGGSDAVANGLYTILAAAIRDFDSKAQNTLNSQDQLDLAIDRLTLELDQLLEDAPLLFIVQHAVKISAVRKRVLSLNSLLKSIQQRIDNVDRILSACVHQEKTTAESS